MHDFFARLQLEAYAKTSGSRGMHVFIPIEPRYRFDQTLRWAERVAILVARENPKSATVERTLNRRKQNQVYIDHLQNAKGKSIAAAYSVRARKEATVSTPLEWKEVLHHVSPQDFTLKTMPERLVQKQDLFKPVLERKQNLDDALERIKEMFK